MEGPDSDALFNPATGVLTNGDLDLARRYIGTQYPLDLTGGRCEWKISDQVMTFGLTRNLRMKNVEGNYLPNHFGPIPPWFIDNDAFPNLDFYDYCCRIENDNTMKIYYSAPSPTQPNYIEMIEFDYRFMNSNNYYNSSTDKIDKVSFQVKNEQVTIQFIDDNGSVFTLTDGTSATSASNVKGINMNTRFLYPKVSLGSGDSIILNNFQGVNITNWTYGDEVLLSTGEIVTLYMDYFAHVVNNYFKPESRVLWLTSREMDIRYTKASDYSQLLGLDAFGIAVYQPAIFTAPDKDYEFTGQNNTETLFGFTNRNPAERTGQSLVAPYRFNWVSDEIPTTLDTESIFVRLNNFTHETYNMSVGNYSKIIYHLPSFNNENLTAGTFWIAANPMVYININNPEPLFINDISIDLVKADETLADELIGKTIIVLHII